MTETWSYSKKVPLWMFTIKVIRINYYFLNVLAPLAFSAAWIYVETFTSSLSPQPALPHPNSLRQWQIHAIVTLSALSQRQFLLPSAAGKRSAPVLAPISVGKAEQISLQNTVSTS